eukprot:3888879-Amphidinium_carterae.1
MLSRRIWPQGTVTCVHHQTAASKNLTPARHRVHCRCVRNVGIRTRVTRPHPLACKRSSIENLWHSERAGVLADIAALRDESSALRCLLVSAIVVTFSAVLNDTLYSMSGTMLAATRLVV